MEANNLNRKVDAASKATPARWAAAAAAFGLTAALAWIARRGLPRTGFDQHYYLEFLKVYRHHLPRSFGVDWPLGYPLLGAMVSRLGLSAYRSLLLISAAALFSVYWQAWPVLFRAFDRPAPAAAALACLAAAAILPIELGGVRSEITFTAFFTAAVLSLARWPGRGAVALAILAAVLSFCIRYVGVLSLGILACWYCLGPSKSKRSWLLIGVGIAAAFAACAGALLWNHAVTGHYAGADRGFGRGAAEFFPDLADFAWAAIVSLTTIGARQPFAAHPLFYLLIGWAGFALLAGLALRRWRRPVSPWSRPLALALAAYSVGIVVMRCYDGFDALYSPRYFLPVLPLVFLLVCESMSARPWAACAILALFCVVPGIAVCVRGVSPALSPDFSGGVAVLRARLRPDDSVGVNKAAFDLSGWIDCPTVEIAYIQDPDDFRLHRFAVVAGNATDRSANHYRWLPETVALLVRLEREGYREIGRWPGYVILERNEGETR